MFRNEWLKDDKYLDSCKLYRNTNRVKSIAMKRAETTYYEGFYILKCTLYAIELMYYIGVNITAFGRKLMLF